MARLFTNGFENNSATNQLDQWNGNSGSPTVGATARTGSKGGTITSLSSGVNKNFAYTWATSDQNGPFFFRFYLKITSNPNADTTIASLASGAGTQQLSLVLTTTGTLKLYCQDGVTQIGSASSALSTGTWYRIEMKFDNSPATGSKVGSARIDGSDFASSLTLTSTNYTLGVSTLNLGGNLEGETATTISIAFDDVALNDSTGSFQTTYAGAGSVIYLRPDSAGDVNTFGTQTGGTAGSSNNYTRVNETPSDGATTFNGSATVNQEDLFNFGASGIGGSDTVNVVEVHHRMRASASGSSVATVKIELEKTASGTILQSSGLKPNTTTFSTDNTVASGLNNAALITYQDPDSGSWTQTTLDSLQAGYKVTTGNTNRADITTLWVVVDYTPSAGGSSIKTVDALAKASVKTMNGVAIASVKTINGLA